MIEIDGKKWFSLTEVSKMFVKKTQTISNWRRQGKLKGKQVSERIYYYSEEDIKNFIEGIYDD